MKKLLFLSLMFSALISTATLAQGNGAPGPQQPTAEQYANMLQQAKEKQIPMLVEKAGLTAAQAERVIELNFEMRKEAATALQGLGEEERKVKLAELKAAKEKKFAEIPLTPEQIKAMYAAYEEWGKNSQRKVGN